MGNRLKKNVPVLRFPEFEGDLELKYLGEILDFKNGINADKSQYGQGIKFINVLDIINDAPIYYDSIIGCVDISDQEFQKNNVQYGDVLFQRSSEIREESGQSNIYLDKNQDATFGGFVIRGRPTVKFNPIYFNYLLKTGSVRKEVTDRSGGSTRFNIGQDSLSQVPILICNSIAEQEKIASFLGAVDTRISQLRRKYELLQTYKRGVMQKIFSQQIRFKCDDGQPFPNWEKKKIKELGNVITGNTPSTNERAFYNGNYLFVSPADIQNKRYIYETKTTLTEQGFKQGRLVKKSSILFVCIGSTIGKIAQAGKDCITNQQINSVIVNCENNSGFVYLVLQYQSSRIKKMAGEHAVPILNKSDFQEIKLQIPFAKEQEKIAVFFTAIDKNIEAVAKQIELTEQFKKGLLQKMFV